MIMIVMNYHAYGLNFPLIDVFGENPTLVL